MNEILNFVNEFKDLHSCNLQNMFWWFSEIIKLKWGNWNYSVEVWKMLLISYGSLSKFFKIAALTMYGASDNLRRISQSKEIPTTWVSDCSLHDSITLQKMDENVWN